MLKNKPVALLQKQRASIRALAAKSGFAPDDLEQRIFVNLRSSHCDAVDATNRMEAELGSPWGENFTPSPSGQTIKGILRNTTDLWEFLAALEKVMHWATRSYVARTALDLPLNWPYLESIAGQFLVPRPERNPTAFGHFLDAIPTAYLFDNEFNAFLDWTDETLPPAIYYNYLLLHTLSELSKIAGLKLMVCSAPEAFPPHVPVPDSALFDSEVARQMSFVLDGKLFSEPFLPPVSVLEPRTFVSVLSLEICSSNFVAFHEYGHLLLGHAEKPHTPDLEFEADLFALRMLSKLGFPNREHAITSVFTIINVMEMAYGVGASHPPSLERMTRLANVANLGFDFDHFEHAANFYSELFDRFCATRYGRHLFHGATRNVNVA